MITISSIFPTIMFIFSLALLFFRPELSKIAINSALNLSASSVIPSLFPCFVITNLWILTGQAHSFSKTVGVFCSKLFHLPPISAHAILIGCLGGFPTGSQALLQLYEKNCITKEEAEQAMLFCSNASPGFVIGFFGSCLFQNPIIGLGLWIIHILSALILGIAFRPPSDTSQSCKISLSGPKQTFIRSLPTAITQAGETTLQVCATIMFFSLITTFLSSAVPIWIKTQPWFTLFLGSIELVNAIHSLAGFPQITAFILSSALISWNGLCVHCQVISSIHSPLSLKKYFLGKLCHVVLSLILASVVSNLLPLQSSCACVSAPTEFHPVALLPFIALLLLYTKTSSGKSKSVRI